MTHTRLVAYPLHNRIHIVGLVAIVCAVMVLYAIPSFASAQASRAYTAGGSEGGYGMSGSVRTTYGGSETSANFTSLSAKISELQSRKDAIFNKLEKRRNGTASSTPHGGMGDWKERYCSGEFLKMARFSQAGYEQRLKVCERWNKSSTTPDVRPPKASSTPVFKLIRPNGKISYKHRVDGAVMISWRNTTKDKTVDIDFKKGSTTTSLAKDVVGKRHGQGHGGSYSGGSMTSPGAVRGASTAGPTAVSMNSHSGESNGCNRSSAGPSFIGGFSNKGGCIGSGNKGPSIPTYSYRWLNAPEGEGYQIVITAKDGDKTYTDESKEFSVKKLPRGMNWYEDESEVLGASTSAEEDVNGMLNQLEDTLIEMTVALSVK